MLSTNRQKLEFPENLNSIELLPLITTGETLRCGNSFDVFVTNYNLITGYSREDKGLLYQPFIIFNYSSE